MVKPTDTQLEPTNFEPLSWLIQPWRGLAIESEHTWAINEVIAEVAEPNGDDSA